MSDVEHQPRAVLLSVCIPTHHGRCALLEEALESIAPQVTPELRESVEIVVSDNASRDGTETMIERLRERHPQLRLVYGRNDRDVRLENIMRVVERASGAWCWLFGSDDVMASDGLRVVLRAIARHRDATGISFGKLNFSHDMAFVLGQDAPACLPSATAETVFTGFETIMRELVFQYAFLSTNVVRRERWLAGVRRAGADVVVRHPDWPQILVVAAMVRRDPVWAWLEDVLVMARAGRPYLVAGDDEPNNARVHAVLVDGLRDVWPQVAGRGTPLHRELLRTSLAGVASESVVRNIKLQRGQTLGRDLLILRSFTRAFWRLPEFRRRCLTPLLVPAAAGRAARRLQARRGSATAPLAPDEMATELRVTLPDVVRPRAMATVRCVITNRGTRELTGSAPHPVAIGLRWFDVRSDELVRSTDRAPLPRPLAPGDSASIEERVNTPWDPGDYELRVSPVQEHVAWFDDVAAANGARFALTLELPPS